MSVARGSRHRGHAGSQSRTKALTSIKASRCELFVFLILRTHLLHLRVNCHDGYHPRSRETGTADPHTVHVIEAEDCADIVAGDRSPIKNQDVGATAIRITA